VRKPVWVIVATLGALLAIAGPAQADSVHFKNQQAPVFTDLGTTLNISGALAGLGNTDVTVTVVATAGSATTCTNQGGNQAPGQNPGDVTIEGAQTIPASKIKNGNVAFNVTTQEPPDPTALEAGCPNPNWDAEITDLDFETATVTVTQGGVVVLQETFTL
jgi:hypothetical protein